MTGRYHLDGKICQRLINVVPARVCMRRSQSTAQLTTSRSDYQTPTLIVTISNLIFSLASLLLEFLHRPVYTSGHSCPMYFNEQQGNTSQLV